jgi:hypothetical protein
MEIRFTVSLSGGNNLRKLPSSVKTKADRKNNAGKGYIPI